MNISTVRTIKDVPSQIWNALPSGAQFSHEWFSFIEENFSDLYTPTYYLAREKETIIGALPTFTPTPKNDFYQNFLFGRKCRFLAKIIKERPVFCFSPYAYKSEILGEHKEELLTAFEKQAKKQGKTAIMFYNINETEKEKLKLLKAYQPVKAPPTMLLHKKWDNFEAYLKTLSKHHQKNIARDITLYDSNQVTTITIEQPEKKTKEILPLCQNVLDHHESEVFQFSENILTSFFKHLKPYSLTRASIKENQIIAIITHLEKDSQLTNFALGLDYSQIKETGAYHNLIYYDNIKLMTEHNIKEIDYGTAAFYPK